MNTIFENRIKRVIYSANAFVLASLIFAPLSLVAAPSIQYVQQGKEWTSKAREKFYSQDQGSQLMPLKWIEALKQPNGSPFLADSLSRYGYLPNEASPTPGLPVGFTVNQDNIGMTCAACHTRQIEVDGTFYRIDGGPAIADFQSFASQLDTAVTHILNDSKAFEEFAHIVLGNSAATEKQEELRKEVQAWYLPYHTIMDKALPKNNPWGPVRLDAVGMIFNRLTGLDIGTTPDHIIASNIHVADAPVRYPFIWNAPIQDKTQWPGFADNGNDMLGLARNLGEVIGVFAHFYPQKDDSRILGVDYLHSNSANFDGLKALENLVKKIGSPQWPWKKGPRRPDATLVAQGKAIYESKTKTEDGGCTGCHGIRKGVTRSLHSTWATPLCNVQTDTREFEVLGWKVDTGVLAGAQTPFLEQPLQAKDELAVKVLGLAGSGSILQHNSKLAYDLESVAKKEAEGFKKLLGLEKTRKLEEHAAKLKQLQAKLVNNQNIDLMGAYHSFTGDWQKKSPNPNNCKDDFMAKEPAIAYESRVLKGIWATAPYLHNGSVPTLADLLKPISERPATFRVGPAYDPVNIGLAIEQTKFDYTLKTTDCSDLHSGNSRCGHEYGTQLTPGEKKALLEYLKTL